MKNDTAQGLNLLSVLKGFIYAVTTSVILILIISLIFHLSPLSEKYLPVVSLIIIFISVFGGGFISSKNAGSKGLIHGIIVAIIFLVFNLILTLVFGLEGFTPSSFSVKALVSLISGSLGGIVGIGFSNK